MQMKGPEQTHRFPSLAQSKKKDILIVLEKKSEEEEEEGGTSPEANQQGSV